MKKTGNKSFKHIYIGIAAISMGMLAFEISLVRLLSLILSYHNVYGITSVALLGSGIGAFTAYYRERYPKGNANARLAFRLTMAAVAMAIVSLLIILISQRALGSILIYGILLCAPFFFQGIFVSSVFRLYPDKIAKLYFFDLAGAALGCVLATLVLNYYSSFGSIIIFSILLALSGIFLAFFGKNRKTTILSGVSVIFVIGIFIANSVMPSAFQVPIGMNIDKEIYDSINTFEGKVIDTKWSSFGRTDIVAYDTMKEQMDIYLDGTAGSPMFAFSGDIEAPGDAVNELKKFPGYFPYQFLPKELTDRVLIIGSGGGRDILISLLGGAKNVTGIEVNHDLVEIVREYSDFNGNIYSGLDGVEIIVDEGRSYLRSHDVENYDVIMLTLPRTNTSRSKEGYALTENYLFTVDSIREYLDLLNDGGHFVVVANDDAEILRLLSLTLSVHNGQGIDEKTSMESLYILGAEPNPVFVLRKGSFTEDESREIYDVASEWEGFNPQTSYFPFVGSGERPINPVLYGVSIGSVGQGDLVNIVGQYGYDISPVNDNSPFFYKLELGLPQSIKMVLLLSLILLIIIFIASLLLNVDKSKARKTKGKSSNFLTFLTLFMLLGIGYMVIEISLIQKFVFFLGKPILSMTIILFTVLMGTGIGSILTDGKRISAESKNSLIAPVIIALLVLIYNYLLLPLMFKYLLSLDIVLRGIFSIIAVLPLSIMMGMPFPLIVKKLGENHLDEAIPWMWGINAAGSVTGSTAAVAFAIWFGFKEAMLLGALAYLIIAFMQVPSVRLGQKIRQNLGGNYE